MVVQYLLYIYLIINSIFIENNLMASPPMFIDSPIKSSKKRSLFDMTPESTQKHVKSVAVRQLFSSTQSNTSEIDSEVNGKKLYFLIIPYLFILSNINFIENYLMATPSILNGNQTISGKKNIFESTPESDHKHIKHVAMRQLISSTESETLTKNSEPNGKD